MGSFFNARTLYPVPIYLKTKTKNGHIIQANVASFIIPPFVVTVAERVVWTTKHRGPLIWRISSFPNEGLCPLLIYTHTQSSLFGPLSFAAHRRGYPSTHERQNYWLMCILKGLGACNDTVEDLKVGLLNATGLFCCPFAPQRPRILTFSPTKLYNKLCMFYEHSVGPRLLDGAS